ncbi:unnamed protein product [Plutella xylostella]|uniref:Phosphatidylinositol-3-phosphatase SAC1 n=1 Tax=Plutella xylostella TaxID=51655 RepID=A0A8S4GAJ2_PLUXY|nr:unnamed protein product [Plutella xylostella]
MADQTLIHDDIKLYTTAEKFYLEPTINPTEIMVIDRVSGESCVKNFNEVKIPIPPNAYKPVCGFLGTIKLISGHYLIVAKYRICMGKINGHDIYQLAGHELIPFSRSNTHLTSKQIDENSTYERMVSAALQTPGIYFSYGYDLTHTAQRLHSVSADFHKMSMSSRAEPRFLWNGFVLKDYAHAQFARFALPLVQGFVSIKHISVGGHQMALSVVSRRAVTRAGTRLFMRGVDAETNAWNTHAGRDKMACDAIKTPSEWHGYICTRCHSAIPPPSLPSRVIKHTSVGGHQMALSVVSRRAATRAGTRLFMRGVDAEVGTLCCGVRGYN